MDKESKKLEWPREAVLHLIELWESFECLYNPKNNFYHNKHARYQALSELAESLNDFMPGIGPAEVKAKINYLRGQFTREVAKCSNKKSGAGADEVYVPTAFWYKKLGFLSDFVKVRKGESNFSSFLDDSQTSVELERDLSPPARSKKRVRPNEESSTPKENDMLEAATEALKSIAQKDNTELDGNDDAFCRFLMLEFRALKNEEIKEELKESFVHLLFESKKKERQMERNLLLEGNKNY
ncbi:PREDICTED: uncharacterized protein LOC108361793 [Rhagoletis zephyria]|uniref:uncharacterized protein LOC108361793 n=1 Tax=Rhagoletis zephyria TaxID=28612 RepID=UPI0008114E5D|nr:PREDICTED: uncharacterized protein LOC108361793 [Rhagoletis zephyria]